MVGYPREFGVKIVGLKQMKRRRRGIIGNHSCISGRSKQKKIYAGKFNIFKSFRLQLKSPKLLKNEIPQHYFRTLFLYENDSLNSFKFIKDSLKTSRKDYDELAQR